jgi:2',3'-cyclic-nucleotide 2'-phosphodiesterase (5'-nucleotidase family)
MKKILLTIPLLFILLMMGCEPTSNQTDFIAPLFLGETSFFYEFGDELPDYTEYFSAIDEVDGDVTSLIQFNDSEINYLVLGTYALPLTLSDLSGNTANLVISVHVLDTKDPVMSGDTEFSYNIGDERPDYASLYTATDVFDGNLSSEINFNDSAVDFAVPGTYELILSVTDTSSNQASMIVEITVGDFGNPVILGAVDITYEIGDTVPDYLFGITADDLVEGDLTEELIIDSSLVNLEVAGLYSLVYTVTDGSDNTFSVTVYILVVDPNYIAPIDQLNVYYINDLHGALGYEEDQMGLARIGNLVLDERSKNPDTTLFIGGGDLLQGTLISNYFQGASTMNVLNTIGMDAFVLGNHEFDWGLPIVTRYRNPLYTNDQVDAPIIGANIFLDGTQTRPEFVDPYTIIQKGNIKVGIIGVMGYGLESSIAVSKIQGYYFANPVYWATHYTEYLRSVEQVDIVLVVLHDNGVSTGFNQTMSQLTGNQRVDAVFNGHSHSSYTGSLSRTGTTSMPYIQSSSNGENLGRVRLVLDSFGHITSALATNLTASNDSRLNVNNALVSSVIQSYEAQIQPLLTEVIMVSGAYMNTSALTYYMAKLMRIATDSDIAFHNLGGTRAPIYNGQDITVATLYQIFPFDNKIKTTYLTGAQINSFIRNGGSYNNIRDDMTFDSMTYYKVATNDFLFDQTYNPFITGIDSEDTGILIRDVLESVLRNQAESYAVFLISNPVEVGTVHQNNIFYLELKKNLNQISL